MTTRIAILADIHANVPAFEAVIADIEQQSPDEIIIAGDLVGRGPQGSAIVERVIELGWPCVRGNHEDYLINFYHGRIPREWEETEEWAASRWMANELSREHVDFIDALPFSMQSALVPQLHIYHGTPASNQEGIGKWTATERLEEIASQISGTAFATAHTHRPMFAEANGVTFVNVGSVGLPFNGDWRAQYAILTQDNDSWEVEFRQVEWDRDAFLEVYEESGFLAEGKITSTLLRQEVLTARPHLVPFMKWAEYLERIPCMDELPDFLEFYDPNLSMVELFQLLQAWDARQESE
ncbi:MAG: metallophosphoesterase family protein [Myxococcota bacterium]|nr:metallophosphoesterase family protein [Myxococcota bacterium]